MTAANEIDYSDVIAGHFTIQAQERIIFGTPAGQAVVSEAERLGARRVFVTSTRSLAKLERGPLQRIEAALGARHAGSFTAISSHSPREDVIEAVAAARAAGADLLVAVGGGSVIDATKAMQLCLWANLDTVEGMEPYRTKADDARTTPVMVPAEPIRMIAVSTTLSASEFTNRAGITDARTNTKQSFDHRLYVPRIVILDPAATLDTPEWLLYATGVRSVDHAVENYCNLDANPATEALSLQGLSLLTHALPAIKASPRDLAARGLAQFGMWQAIAASAAGIKTGASHGIGYALGATFGVPHGHTSCVMLPAVLQWNESVNGGRQAALSVAMGAPGKPAHDLVRALIAGLDQPTTLRGVGIKREDLPEIAKRAVAYEPVQVNPRKVHGPADVMEILELAW